MSSDDEDIPELINEENNNDSDSDDEEKWIEINEDNDSVNIRCLFCSSEFPSIENSFEHLQNVHQFNLVEYKTKFSMDFYSYIKMINFIRCNNNTDQNKLLSSDNKPLWLDEKYMKPANDSYDPWLSYDFDELKIIENRNNDDDEKSNLLKIIQDLQEQMKNKDHFLEQISNDMTMMKESYKRLLEKEPEIQQRNNNKSSKNSLENGVGSLNIDDDNSYFESYSHFSIHHTMLSDKVRTESYKEAILKNPSAFKDKEVLDIGSGTGILSLFASQAGAKNVYAVDQSDIIYHAMEIAQINNVSNIKFLKGRLEDIEMPFKKVDVIISEWMGYFLFFEGMLDSVIYGRKNYLKENGLILPNRCTVSIVGYGSQERYNNFIKFFDNVYGYNMKCVVKDILKEAHVEKCTDEFVLTKPNMISDINIYTCDLNYSNFTYDFSLEVLKDGEMNSICGYFDTFFDLPDQNVFFSTSPAATQTHWHQTLFYFDEPKQVKKGEICYGYNMKCVVKDILKEAHVEKCTDEFVLTKPNMISDINIYTCDLNYSNFTYDFSLEVLKDGEMNSICGYFDTFFDLPDQNVFFSTSPAATQTHWHQTLFYFDEPKQVKKGEIITGKFICQRDRNDLRSLKIELRIFDKTFKYDLN
ncbi:hypothetical protein PVAND_005385 [Polypedilum vanderplanki]|uniref:type I protein arginine methyltransferase n=1 Tax=Polypedilum vanderplanki TaxID=319348 RepID=A0A9J6C0V8_POLVA|nr:hypothetical protein PVAND_005385 [Polypedilum vanderplanki]